tara:strand:- start:1335 stop:2258 length:924 start_codon:yes stop_codon:yes gene_type:complete
MSQDSIQQDTPQESSNQEQYASLEEAVFGVDEGSSTVSSAFTTGNEVQPESAPQGQPEPVQETNTQPTQNNDETRYQYWQSQADKYKNELEAVKQQQAEMQKQPEPAQPAQPEESFPAPPSKPAVPRTFNREEAYADPNSESARYLDEMDSWRDDMSEYNSLRNQYQTAVLEDKINQMEEAKVVEAKKFEAQQKQAEQQSQVKAHVVGHYGMSESEANDFLNTMSDPKSINIDNLVQLYRMRNSSNAQTTATPATPSPTFQQTQNAQQVPSPMGVMPSGQSGADTRSVEDKIMDTMVGNFNDKNPWK